MRNTPTSTQTSLMTDHDGHLPREKNESRLKADKAVLECDIQELKQCYEEYINLNYTSVEL